MSRLIALLWTYTRCSDETLLLSFLNRFLWKQTTEILWTEGCIYANVLLAIVQAQAFRMRNIGAVTGLARASRVLPGTNFQTTSTVCCITIISLQVFNNDLQCCICVVSWSLGL